MYLHTYQQGPGQVPGQAQQPWPQHQQHPHQQHPTPHLPPPNEQWWATGVSTVQLGSGPGGAPALQSQLGSDQQKAVDAVHAGHCVFMTGGAGVGKSYTIEVLMQQLQAKGLRVAKTASSGTAAVNIGGMTVHSWAGILDPFMHPVELAEGKLWGWEKWQKSWELADVLILDEISMVDCDLLEKVDYLARYMRGWRIEQHPLFGRTVHELHPLPFGGLQVVAVGDFFQIPPVDKKDEWDVSPVKKQQQQQRRRKKKGQQEPSPCTVKQKIPVVVAVLPSEAVDVHVAARAAAAAQRTQQARDDEYQLFYDMPPLRQQWQQPQVMQQQQQQPYGGSNAGSAGRSGGAAAPEFGDTLLQPQSVLQLLGRSPRSPAAAVLGQPPPQQAAAATAGVSGQVGSLVAGGGVVGGCHAAAGLPLSKQEEPPAGAVQQPQEVSYLQLQQQQHQHLVKQEPGALLLSLQQQPHQQQHVEEEAKLGLTATGSLLQRMQAAGRLKQWSPEGLRHLKTRLLVQRPDVSSSLPKKPRLQHGDLGLQLLQQPLPQRPAADPQQQGIGSAAAVIAAAAAADGMPGMPVARTQAAAAAAATADVGGGYDADSDDDICWEAASRAIEQAESLSRSQQDPRQQSMQLLPTQVLCTQPCQHLSQQQQQQQQGSGCAMGPAEFSLLSQHQQQQVPESHQLGFQFGSGGETTGHKASRSVPRSCLNALQLVSQPPLPFDAFSMAGARAVGEATQELTGPGAAAGGDTGGAAVVGLAEVVAAAAVPLPQDQPGSASGVQPEGAAAAAALPTVGVAAAGNESSGADIVDLVMDDSEDDDDATQPGLHLSLDDDFPAAAAGAADVDVVDLLDSDSPPPSPIDLTMTPVEEQLAAAQATVAAAPPGAAAPPPALAQAPSWQPYMASMHHSMQQQGLMHHGMQQQPQQVPGHCNMQQQQAPIGPAATPSPATNIRRLSLAGSGFGGGNFNGGGGSSSHNQNWGPSNSSSDAPQWLQLLEQAAKMPQAPPGPPPPGEPAPWMVNRTQRPARNVFGILVPAGLTRSGLFEVREVRLGHVYGQLNGRLAPAFNPSSVVDPDVVRPGGFNYHPNPSAAWEQHFQPAGVGMGGINDCSSSGGAGRSGGAGGGTGSGGSGDGVPQLPVQFLKPLPGKGDYCLKSPAWAAARFKAAVLKQPFRQSDPQLLHALNQLRLGYVDDATRLLLSEVTRPLPDDGIKATHLYPIKKEVEGLNKREYAALAGPELIYPAKDSVENGMYGRSEIRERLDQETNAPAVCALKPDTQVLLVYNLDVLGGLANGTRGVVEDFVSIRHYLKQEGATVGDDASGAQQQQHPSCAGTHAGQPPPAAAGVGEQKTNMQPVHRCGVKGCPCTSQPWSKLEKLARGGIVEVKLPDSDELRIKLPSEGWRKDRLQKAIIYLNHTNTVLLPRVRFTVNRPFDVAQAAAGGGSSDSGAAGGAMYKTVIVGPQIWEHRANTQYHFNLSLERAQLPLLHAWAITVHKSQGMSINRLVVNLARAFTAGMVYVALSRCTCKEGLQVVGHVPDPVCDSDVKEFYRYCLSEAQQQV